jgi:hypothetical protein
MLGWEVDGGQLPEDEDEDEGGRCTGIGSAVPLFPAFPETSYVVGVELPSNSSLEITTEDYRLAEIAYIDLIGTKPADEPDVISFVQS